MLRDFPRLRALATCGTRPGRFLLRCLWDWPGCEWEGLLWTLALLASLLASVYWLWQLYGRPNNQRHWLGAASPPAVICLLIGQTSLRAAGVCFVLASASFAPLLGGDVAVAMLAQTKSISGDWGSAAGMGAGVEKL